MSERCKHGRHSDNPCWECDEERGESQSSLARAPGSAAPTDTERLDWMQRTKTGVNYNVEASGWGVDYEAPLQLTLREAIDREMSQNTERTDRRGSVA